ncbi:DUF1206 domain-containing protein [Actinocorallia sp. A-T 12471]|uniref:DUF1206 domain-containing protein n=1 Tax=Actinocorallia sp. A-T 12471 TaxID=3089813 RepID=UPI0029D12E0B|nr:DUF1206 domain-containing protein [Actinocorallia sp. A-T 12471]MDX6742287.1 DUF1206 domain-containing protein [Actinocorallia sp. A-T 12471]
MAARLGLAGRGVLYFLMGVLALRVAFGSGGQEADNSGAVQTLGAQPGGQFLLWALVVGLFGLAVWRLAEAAFGAAGPDGHKASERVMSLGRGVFYAVMATTTLLFTLGSRGQKSSDEQSKDLTGRAMHDIPGGNWLVMLVGVALVAGALWMAYKSVIERDFMDKLHVSGRARRVVELLGRIGYAARSTVFTGVGVFLVYAGATFDPGKAEGVDGTLREFADTPAGPWLLAVLAFGLALFGVYSACEARWRNVTPG